MSRINGSVLRNARKLAGYTLTELAGKVDITPGYLGNIEHGRRGSNFICLLDRIAKECGLRLEITFIGKEDVKTFQYKLWSDED